MTTAASLLAMWSDRYPESSASPAVPAFVEFVAANATGPLPGAPRYRTEEAVLEWLSDSGLTRLDNDGVGGAAFAERVSGLYGHTAGKITIESWHPVDDPRFTAARELLARTVGPLAEHLLSQVDLVVLADTERPLLAATSMGLPRCILLHRSLLDDTVRLAEHLLHESVHVALYRTYFETTPLRRSYVLGGTETTICAVWHNTTFDTADQRWWWGPERSLHAFVVFAHLFAYWSRLRAQQPDVDAARGGLRTALFAARYLGDRLALIADRVFTPSAAALVADVRAVLPDTPQMTAAMAAFDGQGIQDSARSTPGDEPAGRVVRQARDEQRDLTFVLTESSAFAVAGPPVPDLAAFAATAPGADVAVDGVVLRQMMRS